MQSKLHSREPCGSGFTPSDLPKRREACGPKTGVCTTRCPSKVLIIILAPIPAVITAIEGPHPVDSGVADLFTTAIFRVPVPGVYGRRLDCKVDKSVADQP